MMNYRVLRTLSLRLLVGALAPILLCQPAPVPVGASPSQAVLLAPASPSVVCNGDQLTISANNSTLGSILAAVHKCIGAQMDIPTGASESRLFDQLGPGPARQVLTSLLSATDFDFVIGSSDSNPDKVGLVLLMVRANDATPGAVADRSMSPSRRAFMQMVETARDGRGAPEAASPLATTDSSATPATDSTAPALADGGANANSTAPSDPASPAVQPAPVLPDAAAPARPPAADTNSTTPAPNTTQDPITNMQQMFEQRRQMIEKQNSQPPPQ